MILAARGLALLRGREYVVAEDVRTLAPDVLRHRLVLSYEALGDGITAGDVIGRVLAAVAVPDTALRDRLPAVRRRTPDRR